MSRSDDVRLNFILAGTLAGYVVEQAYDLVVDFHRCFVRERIKGMGVNIKTD